MKTVNRDETGKKPYANGRNWDETDDSCTRTAGTGMKPANWDETSNELYENGELGDT